MDLVVNNGKPVEPSTIKKVVSALKRDEDAVVVLPWMEIQRIVGNDLYNGSTWLKKYKSFTCKYNPSDQSVTTTFHTYSSTSK
jgi:hypothetical protein